MSDRISKTKLVLRVYRWHAKEGLIMHKYTESVTIIQTDKANINE